MQSAARSENAIAWGMNAAGSTYRAAGPGDGPKSRFDVVLEAMRAPFPWAGTPATQWNGSKLTGQMQAQKGLRSPARPPKRGTGGPPERAMCYNEGLFPSIRARASET